MSTHLFTDVVTSDPEEVGSGVVLLHQPDGWIAVLHECGRWADDQESDGEFVKLVAPELTRNGHIIQDRWPTTITPSIACSSCGLHGYVTQGKWRSV